MVPAAALDAGRKLWRTKVRRSRHRRGKSCEATPATGGFLFSHKALAKVFRAKVLDAFERAGLPLPVAVPTTWVVDCRAVGDGQKALLYLGRYLYRGVIGESDILCCDVQGRVTFQYRDARTGKMARRTLPGEDFLWLLLQHVLPKGLRRSRNFGFLHPNSVGAVRLLQLLQLLHVRAARRPPRRPARLGAAPAASRWSCCDGACRRSHVTARR